MQHIKGFSSFQQQVVGEQHYQDALIRIAGPYGKETKRIRCEAVLYLQPDNPHDHNAIRVEIDGAAVGFIPREQASELRQQLGRYNIGAGQRLTVTAMIGGGRIGTRYGVYLDFDEPLELDGYVPPVAVREPPSPVIKPTAVAATAPASWGNPPERKPIEPLRDWSATDPPKRGGLNWWVIGLVFVLFVVAVAVGTWYATTLQQPAAAPLPAPTPAPSATTIVRAGVVFPTPTPDAGIAQYGTLTCADCAATGTPANVWSASLGFVVCRLTWGQQVEILRHRTESGGMSEVKSGNCQGWIRDSLLR